MGGYVPIEHGVKRRNFVYTHGRHLQELRYVVHDADACPSLVLPLSEVEERDGSGLLVLRRVVRDDLLCTLHVFRCKLERYLDRTRLPGEYGHIANRFFPTYFGVIV